MFTDINCISCHAGYVYRCIESQQQIGKTYGSAHSQILRLHHHRCRVSGLRAGGAPVREPRYPSTELLLLKGVAHEEVKACFMQGLEFARRQQARSLELRSATSLARLWQSCGDGHKSVQLLEPVYLAFSEGFDSVDLCEAKKLLLNLGVSLADHDVEINRPSLSKSSGKALHINNPDSPQLS